jgi:hypothetical protein
MNSQKLTINQTGKWKLVKRVHKQVIDFLVVFVDAFNTLMM